MSLIVPDQKVPDRRRPIQQPKRMILDCQDVTLRYLVKNRKIWIVRNQNFTVESGTRLGILGKTASGKTALMRLFAGVEMPNRGRISRVGHFSWPVGSMKVFNVRLTARENCRFVARLYGVDEEEFLDKVQEFSGIGREFNAIMKSTHGDTRTAFAYSVSLLLGFDCYLVDENYAQGTDEFKEKAVALFKKRLETSDMIMVSRNPQKIREVCNKAAILERGRLRFYDDVEEAIAIFEPEDGKAPEEDVNAADPEDDG